MNRTIFLIKVAHTLIFWILSACVLYALFSGITGVITMWTWIAVGLLLFESVALAASGWTCPLTILAERRGAMRGSVADIFLPKWFADRIFQTPSIFGPQFRKAYQAHMLAGNGVGLELFQFIEPPVERPTDNFEYWKISGSPILTWHLRPNGSYVRVAPARSGN